MGSWREWLVHLNSSDQPDLRHAQIEQYFHPEKDIFPKTEKRPVSLTTNPLGEWRSMRDYYPEEIELPPTIAGRDISEFSYPYKIPDPDNSYNSRTNEVTRGILLRAPRGIGPRELMHGRDVDVAGRLGLGYATRSIGLDEQNKPYLSIYDLWDFANSALNLPMKGGTPFNVYDRTPIQMEGTKFPQSIKTRRGDIELPVEKGIGPSTKVVKKNAIK